MTIKRVTANELDRYLARRRPNLLLPPGGAAGWRKCAASPWGRPLAAKVIADAGRVLKFPPLERALTGRRLLDVSRSALYRITTLGTAWGLTGEDKYAKRALADRIILAQGAEVFVNRVD